MNRFRTSWRGSAGVTLIEVLAALALLGSLAVAMVLSRGRLLDQHQRAQQKLEALQVANELIASWWASGSALGVPVDQSAPLEEHPDWYWVTTSRAPEELEPFNAHIVQVRIVDRSAGEPGIELTSVDLVLPSAGPIAQPIPGEGAR